MSSNESGNSQTKEKAPSPWIQSDYRWWFVTDTSSQLGTMVGSFAFTLLAYAVIRDVALAGLTGTVYALCQAATMLIGGKLSDRFNRRWLMVIAGVTSLVVLLALAGTYMAGLMSFPLLIGFAVVRGASNGLFANLTNIVLPQVVDSRALPGAYSSNQTRDAIINLIANPVSGWLFALGPEVPFLVSAVIYVIMSVATLFIKADMHPHGNGGANEAHTNGDDGKATASHSTAMSEGFAWYAKFPQPRIVVLLIVMLNLALMMMFNIIVLDQQQIGTSSWQIGVINTFMGVGMLLGSVVFGVMSKRLTGGRIVQSSIALIGVTFILCVFTESPWLLGALMLVTALPLIPANAVLGAYDALIVPTRLRGRVSAIASLLQTLAVSLSSAIAGVLLKYCGYTLAAGITAVLLLLMVVACFVSKSISSIPHQDDFDTIKPLEL